MRRHLIYTIVALLPLTVFAQEEEEPTEQDNIVFLETSEEMPSGTYTIAIKDIQLKDSDSEIILKTRVGDNARGADIHIGADKIFMATQHDTIVVADGLPDGLKKHDYTLTSSTILRLYRDGVLLGRISTRSFTDDTPPRIELEGALSLKEGYTFLLVDAEKLVEPSQLDYETNLSNMLTGFTNLSTDPYLNTGFLRTGNGAENRSFTTSEAKNLGWGSDIWAETDNPCSGPMCVRLSGQSSYPNEGAALKQAITFKAKTPYVVRAMVNSQGWEGMIGIADEQNFIHITDTQGEWKQVEAVLIPQYTWNATSFETFYVHNADYESDGTLLIDNIEVYEGLSTLPTAPQTDIPAVTIPAGRIWEPTTSVNVYRLGFVENSPTNYAQINPNQVTITGATYFTRTFQGSRLNVIYFPGDVINVTHTGSVDGWDNYEAHLYHGLDFICQRLNPDTGKFEYLDDEAPLTAGCYILQMADNYDNLPVRFDFKPGTEDNSQRSNYWMEGNGSGHDIHADEFPSAEATQLYFNIEKQVFEAGTPHAVRPFEAILCTTDPTIQAVSPEGSTGILRLQSARQGNNVLVRTTNAGGILLQAATPCNLPVFTLSGQRHTLAHLSAGENFQPLSPGIYIVAGKKVIVR